MSNDVVGTLRPGMFFRKGNTGVYMVANSVNATWLIELTPNCGNAVFITDHKKSPATVNSLMVKEYEPIEVPKEIFDVIGRMTK